MWEKSHALALNAFSVAKQIRGRDNSPLIALKSISELEYHLVLAGDLHLISRSDLASLTDQTIEVRKMLYALRNRVVASANSAKKPSERPELLTHN